MTYDVETPGAVSGAVCVVFVIDGEVAKGVNGGEKVKYGDIRCRYAWCR